MSTCFRPEMRRVRRMNAAYRAAGASCLSLLLLAGTAANAAAQKATTAPAAGQTVMLAPDVEAHQRLAEQLTVPVARGRTQALTVGLGDWQLLGHKGEIRVPAQKFFYVAELRTGSVTTMIGSERVTRNTGDIWTVPAGQVMTVTLGPRQETGLLRILTLEPTR